MKESSPSVKRRATAEDVAIGERLRALRLDRGLSQSDLGSAAGVTFQQLQKYEKGTNRVAAARLARIADALNVPVTAFYRAVGKRAQARAHGLPYLQTRGAMRLARAYAGMSARGSRTALVTLAEALAHKNAHEG
jgi:DNA-binding XRE family transcriptional regulator